MEFKNVQKQGADPVSSWGGGELLVKFYQNLQSHKFGGYDFLGST